MTLENNKWSQVENASELFFTGQLDEAQAELEKIIKRNPKNEYAFFFLGNVWYEKESWEKALKSYISALEISPEYIGAMTAASHTLRMLGHFEKAKSMAHQALVQQPDHPDILYLLGIIHYQIGEDEDAKEYLEGFLDTRPQVEAAYEAQTLLQKINSSLSPDPLDEQ